MASTPPIRGIDVSSHDANVDFDAVAKSGRAFAFIKATEGLGYVSPYFDSQHIRARAAGLMTGPYHYLLGLQDGRAQADFFLATIGTTRQPGDLPPAVDIEKDNNVGVGPDRMIPTAEAFCARIRAVLGVDPLVYTYPDYWRTDMGNPRALSQYPLWMASYNPVGPSIVGGWKSAAFWQNDDHGDVPGVREGWERNNPARPSGRGSCDTDIFMGTMAQLRALAGYKEAQVATQFFAETGHSVGGAFLAYFNAHGGVATFGYPRTEEQQETVGTWTGTVQYFQRARMEWHIANGVGQVQLGLIGDELLALKGK